MGRPEAYPQCFYCDAPLTGRIERDHFPIPAALGGTETVPTCRTCHDMNDRLALNSWGLSNLERCVREMPHLSRELRIFLAKSYVITLMALAQLNATEKE